VADVFLSYARPDAAVAQRVARELTKAGWTVWYDSELPVHRSYADVIAAELAHAPAVLVLWSKAAGWSKWGHERPFPTADEDGVERSKV
jgi:adenylate cyclase